MSREVCFDRKRQQKLVEYGNSWKLKCNCSMGWNWISHPPAKCKWSGVETFFHLHPYKQALVSNRNVTIQSFLDGKVTPDERCHSPVTQPGSCYPAWLLVQLSVRNCPWTSQRHSLTQTLPRLYLQKWSAETRLRGASGQNRFTNVHHPGRSLDGLFHFLPSFFHIFGLLQSLCRSMLSPLR